MSEWRVFKLGDLSKRITSGGTPSTKRPDYYGGRIPWLKTQEINFNRIYRTETYISEEGLKASSAKWIDENSIIVAMYGATAGGIAINKIPITTNQACCNITINEKLANYEFIYYNLLNRFSELKSLANGAAQQNLNVGMISNLNILLPPLSEQKAIAHILGSLDDKIELNRRMNETLEAMARAIFKDWFVDFGPTRAKIEGRAPYLPEPIWSLFPDAIDPESGLPQGWEKKSINELFSVSIGRTPPRKETQYFVTGGKGKPWLSIKTMGEVQTYVFNTEENLTKEAVETFRIPLVPEGTVMISFKLTVGRIAIAGRDMYTNEAIAHLVHLPSTPISSEYIYCFMKSFDFSKLGSTSSIATAVNSKSIKQIEVSIPSPSLSNEFDRSVKPIFETIKSNVLESHTLAELRDRLLPKLMSGEIRVKDAERLVEEVL